MKKNLLLLALCTTICLQANAAVTVEDATSPEYVINNGYSEMAAEQVQVSKNRALGKPAEPLYEKRSNRFVKFWKDFYGYINPAYDTDDRLHHDIQPMPSWKDY